MNSYFGNGSLVSVKLLVQTHSRLLRKLLQLLLSVVIAAEIGSVVSFRIGFYSVPSHDNVKTSDLIFVAFQNFLKIKDSECVLK